MLEAIDHFLNGPLQGAIWLSIRQIVPSVAIALTLGAAWLLREIEDTRPYRITFILKAITLMTVAIDRSPPTFSGLLIWGGMAILPVVVAVRELGKHHCPVDSRAGDAVIRKAA